MGSGTRLLVNTQFFVSEIVIMVCYEAAGGNQSMLSNLYILNHVEASSRTDKSEGPDREFGVVVDELQANVFFVE